MKLELIKSGPFRALVSWLIAVAAAWLAVGTQSWSQTLLIAGLGVLYLFVPPSAPVPRSLLVLSCLLLLLATTALLPASWFSAPFRQSFEDQGIHLPWTYSPQPWWSLEDLTLLIAGLLWMWNCVQTELSLEHRQFLLNRFLIALGVVALVTIVDRLNLLESWPPVLREIGQFANRNQTGDILVLGGICSLAQGFLRIGKDKTQGILWLFLTLIFLTAIILNGSRAGLLLFALGLPFLLALVPKGARHRELTLAVLVVVLMIGTLIFVSQGAAMQARLNLWSGAGKEGRLAVYLDAASMVRLYPWVGVGLGNFEGVFNTLRIHSGGQMSRNLHPESDWWWAATEMGIGSVLILGLLLIIVFQLFLRRSPFPTLTKMSVSVAVLFGIHSLFDVGGHRMGTAWSCLYLVGLGAFRSEEVKGIILPKIGLRMVGLVLLVVTGLRIQSASLEPWMPTRASLVKIQQAVTEAVSPDDRTKLLDRGIAWAPLDWLLYYQRGLVLIHVPDGTHEADIDFNRALYLEQSSVELPTAIGNICVHRDFPEAMKAWKQVLQRAGYRREQLFTDLLGQNLEKQQRNEISTLAGDDPQLQAIAVIYQEPAEFSPSLQNLLEVNPTLRGVSDNYLRKLFERWVDVGDTDKFIQEWPQQPEWQTAGWRANSLALAKRGREKEAITAALHFMPEPNAPKPSTPQDLETSVAQFRANPQDAYQGILLYFAQKSRGLNDDAMDTLLAVAKLPQPPAYVRYLLAKNLLEIGREKDAWQVLEPLLHDQ